MQHYAMAALCQWEALQKHMEFVPDAYSGRHPILLAASKDKPVLLFGLAGGSDILLTLDKKNFSIVLNTTVYGMLVTTPKQFLLNNGFLE